MKLGDVLRRVGIGKLPIRAGGIYRLKDDLIQLPDAKEHDNRTKHDFRTVLVLSNQAICVSYSCPCVIVAPMSSKTRIWAETDLIVKATSTNKLNGDGRIMLGYMQPILKSDLEKEIGILDEDQWQEVMVKIVWNFDH